MRFEKSSLKFSSRCVLFTYLFVYLYLMKAGITNEDNYDIFVIRLTIYAPEVMPAINPSQGHFFLHPLYTSFRELNIETRIEDIQTGITRTYS